MEQNEQRFMHCLYSINRRRKKKEVSEQNQQTRPNVQKVKTEFEGATLRSHFTLAIPGLRKKIIKETL